MEKNVLGRFVRPRGFLEYMYCNFLFRKGINDQLEPSDIANLVKSAFFSGFRL